MWLQCSHSTTLRTLCRAPVNYGEVVAGIVGLLRERAGTVCLSAAILDRIGVFFGHVLAGSEAVTTAEVCP